MIQIGGLQKLTLIDFPGRVAATVFLCGCNLRCPWCYSRELVLPELIAGQPKITEKEFFDFLADRKGLLDGIVICGGEPTLNPDLADFISKIKKMGYAVKLDTNGSNPAVLEELIDQKLIDYVALDIKLPKERYEKELKIKAEEIEKSIEILRKSGIDHEFRTTVVPGVHTKEDIIEIAQWLTPAKKYYLQSFRPEKTLNPEMEKIKPYLTEQLSAIREEIAPLFEICEIR